MVETDDGPAEELALERAARAGAEKAAADYLIARTRVLEAEYERLHLGHFREWLYTAAELVVALIVLLIFAALASAVYEASRADGLVIESFGVPPDMAAKGLSGPVLASKLLDRLNAMQDATESARAASSFSHDWTNDIKVEIPDTGVSLGEVIRYLHDWLGREMHLSGDVYEIDRNLVLTVRLDSEPGQTFQGTPGDLDVIVQRAAEAIFRRAQPYRYAIYLLEHRRVPEAEDVFHALADTGSVRERVWAEMALAFRMANADRNDEASAYAKRAIAADPQFPNPYGALQEVAQNLGHDEDVIEDSRRFIALMRGAGSREWAPSQIVPNISVSTAFEAEELGDYRAAIPAYEASQPTTDSASVKTNTACDAALLHDVAQSRARLATFDPKREAPQPDSWAPANARYALAQQAIALSDWRDAVPLLNRSEELAHGAAAVSQRALSDRAWHRVTTGPWLAYAYAMLGAKPAAAAILNALPGDCYVCARMRGRVAAHDGHGQAAAWWFARAVTLAPSPPFAYADWGAMLMAKGDLDGAIAKFESAHRKGPHFADALEMWGEALMAKNRSDLALAKFEEAGKDAPNWGRLHLKWGEALLWSGDKVEAGKQLAIASNLDLSTAEKAELARVRHG